MEPLFLTTDEVVEIHRDMIERYGGRLGIRDQGLLESALAQPQASFGGVFLHGDLFAMAAAYLFHIVKDHPFVDGNKRAAFASAVVFLAMNDWDLISEEDDAAELVLAAATGVVNKDAIAKFLRTHSRHCTDE